MLFRRKIVPSQWREALLIRLRFRLHLLQLMGNNNQDRDHTSQLLQEAQRNLSIIRSYPAFEPPEDSPAYAAFDPYVARRLNTFMPVRVVELPSRQETWAKLQNLLEGLDELIRLSEITDVATWDVSVPFFFFLGLGAER
jgi:N-alpha-acetyltransferase 35, NatC auxiliary subunit